MPANVTICGHVTNCNHTQSLGMWQNATIYNPGYVASCHHMCKVQRNLAIARHANVTISGHVANCHLMFVKIKEI